jgi:hypothetical protein
MKVYGIACSNNMPQSELIDAARRVAHDRLVRCEDAIAHYGVGYIGIHEGKTGNFVFISCWANENELYHHVYISQSDQPHELEYMTPAGLAACTWDLRVMCFERDAWVASVLKKYPKPDIDEYLNNTLNVDA